MERKRSPRGKKTFERIPRVTRSQAAAAAADTCVTPTLLAEEDKSLTTQTAEAAAAADTVTIESAALTVETPIVSEEDTLLGDPVPSPPPLDTGITLTNNSSSSSSSSATADQVSSAVNEEEKACSVKSSVDNDIALQRNSHTVDQNSVPTVSQEQVECASNPTANNTTTNSSSPCNSSICSDIKYAVSETTTTSETAPGVIASTTQISTPLSATFVPIPLAAAHTSGIQVTTMDLLHVHANNPVNSTSLAQHAIAPLKVEGVIDMSLPAPITAAWNLEELLASQQCLSELERAGAVDGSGGAGLTQLMRAAAAGSAVPTKSVTAGTSTGSGAPGTGDMGLTLLAQAAAQEEKTGDVPVALPSIGHLTSGGFTSLPPNDSQAVIYQQPAVPVCLPDVSVENCATFAASAGVASWTDSAADLSQYNWFNNMAATMNATHAIVPHVTDHLPMPPSITMETFAHPHMLLFDGLSAAPPPPPHAPDVHAQFTALSRPAAISEHVGVAYRAQHVGQMPADGSLVSVGLGDVTNPLQQQQQEAQKPQQTHEHAAVRSRAQSTTGTSGASTCGSIYQQPKCAYCDLRFKTRTIRDQHARCCASNPYKCPSCGKACLGTVKLQRHIRSHLRSRASSETGNESEERRANGGPDPKCAYCNARFPSRVVRDRHSRMCIKNPYRCQLCSKAFLGTAKLTRHMRCHTIEGNVAANMAEAALANGTVPNGILGGEFRDGGCGTGSEETDSSSVDDGSGIGGSSECNDVAIDDNTERPQAADGHIQQATTASILSLEAAAVTAPAVMASISEANTSSLPAASLGSTLVAHQVGAINTDMVPAQPHLQNSAANGLQSTPSSITPAITSTVPMMVAMPLLSCW